MKKPDSVTTAAEAENHAIAKPWNTSVAVKRMLVYILILMQLLSSES